MDYLTGFISINLLSQLLKHKSTPKGVDNSEGEKYPITPYSNYPA
jgi:hypothetical protein